MIEIKNVTKKFDKLTALKEVSATIEEGHVFGLIGTNGAGKSTLMRSICGVYRPDEGEVLVDGEPVKMTPMEFKILSLLMRNPGRVFSAEEIYERVWNERAINTDTVMVHVRKIREKIEYNPKEPKYLKVVWGVGYKIEKIS